MKEYIDRQEAIEKIREYKGYFQDQESSKHIILKMEAENVISDLEAADVAPVMHGWWKLDGKNHCHCTNCNHGRNVETQIAWEYCPNCGAKMDGGKANGC